NSLYEHLLDQFRYQTLPPPEKPSRLRHWYERAPEFLSAARAALDALRLQILKFHTHLHLQFRYELLYNRHWCPRWHQKYWFSSPCFHNIWSTSAKGLLQKYWLHPLRFRHVFPSLHFWNLRDLSGLIEI